MRHTFGGILSGLGAYLNYQRYEHSPKRRLPIIEKLGSNMLIVKVTKASKLEGPYQLIHKSGMRILHGSDVEALRDFSVTLATHPLAGPALRTLPTDDTATALFAWEKFRKSIPKDALMDLNRYKVAMTTYGSEELSGMDDRGPTPHQLKYAMQKLARTVKRCNITPSMLREGMKVELEHRNVTHGGVAKTARIAAAHMCERRDYYTLLKKYVEPLGGLGITEQTRRRKQRAAEKQRAAAAQKNAEMLEQARQRTGMTQEQAYELIQRIGMGGNYADAALDFINRDHRLEDVCQVGYPHLTWAEAQTFAVDLIDEYDAQVES